MARRRFRFWVVLILITIILATGLWVRQAWYRLLQTNGIEQVHWQGFDLSLSSISFDTFDVRQVKPGRQIVAQGQGLSLAWQWNSAGVQVTSLTIEQLQFDLQSEPDAQNASSASQPLPDIPQEPPAWLPRQVAIEHFKANLPCATGQCPLDGSLSASRDATLLPLKASLTINDTVASKKNTDPERDTHQIQLNVDIDGTWPDALNLVVNLAADGEQTLTAQTEYRRIDVDQTSRWGGTVDLPRLPQIQWVLDWLSQWQPLPVDDLPQQPEAAEVAAQWALQWPSEADALKQISGSLTARANLSEPWPLPGVGTLQGNIEIGLKADRGQWLAQTVQSDLQLSQPATWVTQLPEPLRPENLSIQMWPAEPISETKAGQALLPINLTLKSRGKASIDINSHLGFSAQAPWRVTLARTRVQGSLPSYAIGNWQLEQP